VTSGVDQHDPSAGIYECPGDSRANPVDPRIGGEAVMQEDGVSLTDHLERDANPVEGSEALQEMQSPALKRRLSR
jgi:hypothetical protein